MQMPSELEPAVDAYGSKARRSALADFVELWALDGQNPTVAAVGDYVRDNGWLGLWNEAYTDPAVDTDAVDEALADEADGGGTAVFDLHQEREELLGARYPFQRVGERLQFVGAGDEPYLGLLCLTIAHAYAIPAPVRPTSVFEEVVTRALQTRLQRAVNFGGLRAAHPDFAAALLAAGPTLQLEPTPDAAPHAVSANDEHVDVIGHAHWGDQRPGKWTMVGQVTCGTSDTWPRKMAEVPVPGWASYLNAVIDPLAFLAVPHHVEEGHFSYLVTHHRRLLLDRPRLTRWLPELSADERALVAAVRSATVSPAP
jgi:hypothetical protein